MAKLEGFNVRVFINGTPFRVKRVERDDTCADLEVGDSEDGVFEDHTGGRRVAKLTFENATLDLDDSPFVDPFTLRSREHCEIDIFFDDVDNDFDSFPDVLITSGKVAVDVANLQPCSFSGVSCGEYFLAGDI